GDEEPVVRLAEGPDTVDLMDAQVSADGEVDEGGRDVARRGPLLVQGPDLAGPQPVGRREPHRDGRLGTQPLDVRGAARCGQDPRRQADEVEVPAPAYPEGAVGHRDGEGERSQPRRVAPDEGGDRRGGPVLPSGRVEWGGRGVLEDGGEVPEGSGRVGRHDRDTGAGRKGTARGADLAAVDVEGVAPGRGAVVAPVAGVVDDVDRAGDGDGRLLDGDLP